MEDRVNTSDPKAYNTKRRSYELPTVWDLCCRGWPLRPIAHPSDSARPLKQKTGQAETPARFFDSVSLVRPSRFPQKTPSHSERAKGGTQQHHCCAAVRDSDTRRRKRMAFRPDLSNRREHYGTNCCEEQGDFSDGDWIYFHNQQQSNDYATSRVRFR